MRGTGQEKTRLLLTLISVIVFLEPCRRYIVKVGCVGSNRDGKPGGKGSGILATSLGKTNWAPLAITLASS